MPVKTGISRLLKNAHLRRCPHPSLLRRTSKYASLLRISGALHLGIFEQPAKNDFFSKLLGKTPAGWFTILARAKYDLETPSGRSPSVYQQGLPGNVSGGV